MYEAAMRQLSVKNYHRSLMQQMLSRMVFRAVILPTFAPNWTFLHIFKKERLPDKWNWKRYSDSVYESLVAERTIFG